MSPEEKAAHSIGPGGYKCPCCGPAPKDRPQYRRLVRRRMRAALERELDRQDLSGYRCQCGEGEVFDVPGGKWCTNCGDQWA